MEQAIHSRDPEHTVLAEKAHTEMTGRVLEDEDSSVLTGGTERKAEAS